MLGTKILAIVVLVTIACVGPLDAKPTAVKTTKTWSGSMADEKLLKEAPENGVITTAKAFEQLIKAWNVAAKVADVNFAKELVLVTTSSGSRVSLSATLDETGDLKALGIATADFGPGFRYVIISVPKDGVRTVNGKQLPK